MATLSHRTAQGEIRLTDEEDSVWYFAYGSNMCSSVFLTRRGIQALKTVPATIPGYVLCFDVPGVPYLEPALGSIRKPRLPMNKNTPDVIGIAYLVTHEDMARIRATEGGGLAYKEVCLTAQLIGPTGVEEQAIKVWTLNTRSPARRERLPSLRYMNLLVHGAEENQLPLEYHEYLSSLPVVTNTNTRRYRIGSLLFLSFWRSVQRALEWGIRTFKNDVGVVPKWFIAMFDVLLFVMWCEHDFFFCPLFGRGDGL